MTRPILVTGGTGFVGSALVPQLVHGGAEVHVLARSTSRRDHLSHLPVQWHTGDLLDPLAVQAAVAAVAARGAERGEGAHVVHNAALISYDANAAERSRRVNVEGTRILLDACLDQGVERVCLVSSVVAVGFTRDRNRVLTEDSPFNGYELGCHYTTTKRAAEDFARAVARQLDIVIVNPGAIFGPSPAESNAARFLRLLAVGGLGRFAPPGSIAPVGVADVAEGIRLALERGRCGQRYLLTERNLTHLELLRLAAAELGVPPPRGAVPRWMWRVLVGMVSLVEPWRPPRRATSRALRHLGVHYRFDSSRARAELGWTPESFPEVLRSTVRALGPGEPSG